MAKVKVSVRVETSDLTQKQMEQKRKFRFILRVTRYVIMCCYNIYNNKRKGNQESIMRQKGVGNSNRRVLDIYLRLAEGKLIRIKEEEQRFGVSSRSIKRDITEIRIVLANRYKETTVLYDKKQNGYKLSEVMASILKNEEIFGVCKVLLESKAFRKAEMDHILDILIKKCLSKEDQKEVLELIRNERFYYTEPSDKNELRDLLWDLGVAVKKQKLLQITYQRETAKEPVRYTLEPAVILFSECYFYLAAYLVEMDEEKEFANPKENYITIYRIDQILDFQVLEIENNSYLPYKKRLEERELKKQIPFINDGELMRIQLRYTGKNIDFVLNKLPTAEIKKKEENGYLIDVEIFGEGILGWILSQREDIEIIKPVKLRNKLKEMLRQIIKKYEN